MEERGTYLPARRVARRLMRIDVNAFLGAYPYRRVPGTSPDGLLRAMTRAGIDEAWVSHLPSLFWRQPMAGNAWLYETVARRRGGAIRCTTGSTRQDPRCATSPRPAVRRICPS